MRRALLLGGPLAAAFALAAACSSFSGDPVGAATDAAPEATVPEAGVDAALPPTPGVVECFGAQCKDGNDCCYDPDAGTTACTDGAKRCGFGVVTLHCDDESDCAPNQVCCVGLFGSSDCVAASKCNGERLCHANSECDVGSSCVEVPCRGAVIGACGPVGPYVKGFCK